MNQNSSSQGQAQTAGAKRSAHAAHEICIGEWVAPMIAWVAVIALGLAIAGFLLGEQ
jgi:hypothetical protein